MWRRACSWPSGTSDSVRISVELVDTKRRKRQWGDVRVVPKRDLAMTMDSMVRAITVSRLPGALGARAWQAPVLRDSLAYNYYLLAQHHYNRFTPTELARSIAYYDSVLARDPAFVGAWIGRANVLMAMASGNGRLTGREALVPLRRALDTSWCSTRGQPSLTRCAVTPTRGSNGTGTRPPASLHGHLPWRRAIRRS